MESSLNGFYALLFYLVQRLTEVDTFSSAGRESKEFCHFTRFELTCALDQVLFIHRALYGRMRVGSCVRTNFGFVGCYVDVLDVLDQRCAGRRSCTFDVVEPTFENRRPCNVELKNYLEVEYTCVTVSPVPPGSCEAAIYETNSLPLNRHDTKKCGTTSHPWRIIAPRIGQRYNVTLVDLSNGSVKELSPSTTSAAGCQRYVTVNEPLRHTSRDVCIRKSVRENFIYTSESEVIELIFNMSGYFGEFLLILTAAGCPDFPASRGSWVKYSADRSSADVGCSEQIEGISWHLICTGQQWSGHMGNCSTDSSDSSSVSSAAGKHDHFKLNPTTMVVLWLVVSSSISLSVLLLGLLIHRQVKKRRRKSRSRGDDHVTTEECVTPPEDQPEVHHTSASCHVYHAFLHKGPFTSVGFQAKQQRRQANCACVCKTCISTSPCIRQGKQQQQLIVIPKDEEDDSAIKTSDTTKSLLMAVEHCPRCCTHRDRDNDYE